MTDSRVINRVGSSGLVKGREVVLDFPPEDLRSRLAAQDFRPFVADQVLRWVYQKGVTDFRRMTNISGPDRERLAKLWRTGCLTLERSDKSRDGTAKFLFRLRDGNRVETVWIPEGRRKTVCVSTQAGCPLGCKFCLTGAEGFARNLTSGEIVDQVCRAMRWARGARPTNVVMMGMGEPLLNLASVCQALEILMHERGMALSGRRITVSTVGLIPQMKRLMERAPVKIAVSLHATTDAVRNRLMPIGRKYPLASLFDACRKLPVSRRDRITFEYLLLAGVNDSIADARRLVRLLHGIPAKVNLIPMNEHYGSPYRPPPDRRIEEFRKLIAGTHLHVSLRRSRGDDILAACGQLRGPRSLGQATGHGAPAGVQAAFPPGPEKLEG